MTIQISPEDAWLLDVVLWHTDKNGYVLANTKEDGRKRQVLLHRLITQAPGGIFVDHIDGDPSNNRRENLRLCSHAENMRNRKMSRVNKSGFKGVWANKGKWRAGIKANSKNIPLGTFDTPEAAHAAYVAAAKKYHGEFARAQ